MKTKLYHGLRLVPISSCVGFISDNKRTDYEVIYNYVKFKLTASFVSVKVKGFWIGNAMCMN